MPSDIARCPQAGWSLGLRVVRPPLVRTTLLNRKLSNRVVGNPKGKSRKESSLGYFCPCKIQNPHSWEIPSDESQFLFWLNPVSPSSGRWQEGFGGTCHDGATPSILFCTHFLTRYHAPVFMLSEQRLLQFILRVSGFGMTKQRVCAQLCLTLYDPMDCSLPGSSPGGFSRHEY